MSLYEFICSKLGLEPDFECQDKYPMSCREWLYSILETNPDWSKEWDEMG